MNTSVLERMGGLLVIQFVVMFVIVAPVMWLSKKTGLTRIIKPWLSKRSTALRLILTIIGCFIGYVVGSIMIYLIASMIFGYDHL